MRICIPVEFQAAGGGFYVLRELARYLAARGHTVTNQVADRYDLLLLNSWHVHYDDLLAAIRHNPRARIVHRVDGSSQDYGRDARGDRRQRRVNRFADVTIFQSQYCRHSTREKFPVITHDGPVIYNAVDTDRFSPVGAQHAAPSTLSPRAGGEVPVGAHGSAPFSNRASLPGHAPRLVYVTHSTNPMKGWGDVYALARQHPDLAFILVGNYDDPPALPNLHVLGVLDRDEMPPVLRACDVSLAFQRNEACPNVVLEAMASGLPVLYVESGATPELVGDGGLPVTVETFRAQLDALLATRESVAARARQRAVSAFHPDVVFAACAAQFEAALRQPTGWRGLARWLWAWAVKVGRPLRDRVLRR